MITGLDVSTTIINKLKNKQLIWEDLFTDCRIDESVLEYVDAAEQNTCMIAMEPADLNKKDQQFIYKYTH